MKRCATSCCRRWPRTARHLFAVPADLAQDGRGAAAPILEWDAKRGTIVFEETARSRNSPSPAHVKLQWKADWRCAGWRSASITKCRKDLISSVELSSKIVRAIGGVPPEGFNYELFLDDGGQKISKSKGNGLSVDEC